MKIRASQSTDYFAARTSSEGVAFEIRRRKPNGSGYEAVIDSFRAGYCKFTEGRIEYRIDRRPARVVDFRLGVFEGSFSLSRSMIEELIAGKKLHINREDMERCVFDGSPLRLEFPLAGLARAFAEMTDREFIVDFKTIANDENGLRWRGSERLGSGGQRDTGLEGTLALSSERTKSGYPVTVEGMSIGSCGSYNKGIGKIVLSIDDGPPVEIEASLTAPVFRTGYRGWATFFIGEDTIASLKKGAFLVVRICADEGPADLKFDLSDFERAWSETRPRK